MTTDHSPEDFPEVPRFISDEDLAVIQSKPSPVLPPEDFDRDAFQQRLLVNGIEFKHYNNTPIPPSYDQPELTPTNFYSINSFSFDSVLVQKGILATGSDSHVAVDSPGKKLPDHMPFYAHPDALSLVGKLDDKVFEILKDKVEISKLGFGFVQKSVHTPRELSEIVDMILFSDPDFEVLDRIHQEHRKRVAEAARIKNKNETPEEVSNTTE